MRNEKGQKKTKGKMNIRLEIYCDFSPAEQEIYSTITFGKKNPKLKINWVKWIGEFIKGALSVIPKMF